MGKRRQHGSRAIGLRMALPLLLVFVVALLAQATRRLESAAASPFPLAPTLSWRQAQAVRGSSAVAWGTDIVTAEPSLPLTFESGETLGSVLTALGLTSAEAHEVAAEIGEFVDLKRLRPVDRYLADYGASDRVQSFELVIDGRGRATVDREVGGWEGSWQPFERTLERRTVSGELQGSFEASIARAGGPDSLAVLMSDVFQWDLDFTRDLRSGDTFQVLFESVYLDGAYYGVGAIIAAIYVNDGRPLEAYRFGDSGQYYDAEGRPTRKMFLRSPLRYSRVTSRFTSRRFHPVLKRYRPHYGVDYGAPVGTPVRATATGRVVSAGWDRGGGRTVKLRHANGFLTAYLHLSRFSSGIRAGRRVQQGEVIGYVGSTGLSTAPHLDYRVQRNGRWIDPLSLRSVPAEPIPTERLAEFLVHRDELRASLERVPSALRSDVEDAAALVAAAGPVGAGSGVAGVSR